jgi:tetratricopeptide (TPR) repeat protein
MMITDMSRSGLLHVLSRQQLSLLLPSSTGKSDNPVPFDQALRIAHAAHAANVLIGSFSSIDGKVRIDVQLHDTSSGQITFADHVVFPETSDLLSQVDILAGRLANAMEVRSPAKPNLSEVTTNSVEAYRYYSLGVEKSQEFEDARAIELLKQATVFDPQFAMAYARIGYTYALADFAPEQGRPFLKKAMELSSHLTEMDRLYVTAWSAISNSDYTQAAQVFRQIIQSYPQEAEAYWRLARLLRASERSQEALQVLQQGLALNPNDKDIYNTQGLIFLSLRRYSEAIEAYRQYVEAAPEEPNAHDSLGMSYQQSGNYDAAIDEYNRALALDPEFEPSIIHLGDAYYQTGQYRKAIYQYQRYIKVGHTSNARSLGYGNLATVYLALNDLPEAEVAAANELRNNPNAVWNSLLIALKTSNKASASRFERILFRDIPTQERGTQGDLRTRYYYQGYIDMESGVPQKALAEFQTALQHLPPSSGMDLYEDCVADAQLRMGQYKSAIAAYKSILALNPNYPLAHYHLAQAYADAGDAQDSQSEYRAFLQSRKAADPGDPAIVATRQALSSKPLDQSRTQ